MTVARCSECGARQVTRSRFEVDCSECGGELVEEDAYDPEPEQLCCVRCGYVVDAGGARRSEDDDYAATVTVDDPCPRCKGELVAQEEKARSAQAGSTVVRDAPDFALARAAAQRLLKRHWPGDPPVDVRLIAEAVGLPVIEGDFDHQGLLEDGVIKIPRSESGVAKRFAVAHEIGHHELRHLVNEARIEPEANAFASELLVPRDQVRAAVAAGLDLTQLRRLFDVSREAILYALDGARLLNKVKG